jgi:HTH-type transcriptional regulator, global nitrogen regulator NrpRI
MTMLRTERKYVEILRILKDHQEPMGAKRLSELMADRGYVLSDRAVQYYLSYLDAMGFTEKVGNQGRILTREGIAESENALVEDRIGFVISKLERLAFRSTFDPQSGTGDVAYNLTMIPEEQLEGVCTAFDEVIRKRLGFFSSYHVVDQDPRIPAGSTGIMTICSITMDGVLQRRGVPVRMAYGGRLAIEGGKPFQFLDLIGYRGTTIDPLQLFISAGLTSISTMMETSSGTVLANVREVPVAAGPQVQELSAQMRSCGFEYPVSMGTSLFNLRPDPYRLSIVAFSGMNFVGNAVERGYRITTEIGAGNISFSRITDTNR